MWNITAIKAANKANGGHWFERSTLRFFNSRILAKVYQGPGGIYFVSSEQFVGSQGAAPRKFTVRQFDPKTGDVDTVGEFNELTMSEAKAGAKALAKGEGGI
jgi:hypothetical protein